MLYLAGLYSHPDPAVREQRFHAACAGAAELIRAGNDVYCPVVLGHPLVEHGLPTDWSFWQRQARAFLERCDELVVAMIEGWEESVGVKAKISIADKLCLPIRYVPRQSAN